MKDNSKARIKEAQERGRITNSKIAKEKRLKYLENPTKCICGNIIEYENRNRNKFCSQKCAAKENNKTRNRKLKHKNEFCLYCGKPLSRHQYSYCSIKCDAERKRKNFKELLSKGVLSDERARFGFRKISEHKCSICGRTEWNDLPIPVVVDHIDGNHLNNYIDNLRMVCCNCDAQLSTYKSKNLGNGRSNRRKVT